MKTSNEIHRQNLALLVTEYGSVAAAAEKISTSSSQFSQWLNASENSGTGKPRGISPGSCRKIEEACGKPTGWMDADHEGLSASDSKGLTHARAPQLQWVLDDEAEFLNEYRQLDSVDKNRLLDTAKALPKVALTGLASNKF